MIALLAILAALQYVWLGQVSDGERERLKSRLEADTRRFADDFNREIQSAYFNFQLPAKFWGTGDWGEFNDRYEFWRERAAHPDLIKGFTYVGIGSGAVWNYEPAKTTFVSGALPDDLKPIAPLLTAAGDVPTVADDIPALLMPVYDIHEPLNKLVVRAVGGADTADIRPEIPNRSGFLIIQLDRSVIENGIFADLSKKYFAESDGANYKLAVLDRQNRTVFGAPEVTVADSTAKLLDLAPDNFVFYTNREILPKSSGVTRSVVFSTTQRTEKKSANSNSNVELRVITDEIKPRVDDGETQIRVETPAVWILNAQHTSGSLEAYITGTRRKNLAVGFGILFLIGGSVLAIFLSAQRARLLAQRQVDFVSSVSHEFRTPLAVIYSASENLADGVAREPAQISRYGELIKGEGRKLSAMVEQILEFAGARSGKRRYDFQPIDLDELIDEAIEECRPLIDREQFEVERERCGHVNVSGDKSALTGAFQNLIANSIKYSNGSKWMRIGCRAADGGVCVEFEDHGIGIAADDLKHIFEPFYRAKSVVDEQIHGNGLGLSLVKETVEAHGGTISAESEPGKGSKFTINLPEK